MRKLPRIETTADEVVAVLSVSSIEQDDPSLARILSGSTDPKLHFQVEACRTLASASVALHQHEYPIVVCERDLSDGSWKELLDHAARLPAPPLVIVTSRLADERLWAEALNLGAYDVMPKPFYAQEVCRIIEGAWLRWKEQRKFVPVRQSMSMAAGTR